MVRDLRMSTIFEGVEDETQIEFLKEIGCQYGQGYVFAKPMSLSEYDEKYL